jgi:thiosulfate/3-mercaptopyruvate sulfurtransferase
MTRRDVLVSATELAERLATDPAGLALLDVRWRLGEAPGAGRERYAEEHLPGARFLDLEAVITRHTADPRDGRHPLPEATDLAAGLGAIGVRADDVIVVYDEAGSFAAARAWWVLTWAGLDVRVLDGGIDAWILAGGPLDTGVESAPATRLDLATGALLTATAEEAAAAEILVDVRAPERYRGETEPLDPKAGHIPGAVNIPVSGLFGSDGRLPPEAVLRERFGAVLDGRSVTAYCGSGVSAAHAVLALATLGLRASLYPGSWSAWSNDPTRPVATGD